MLISQKEEVVDYHILRAVEKDAFTSQRKFSSQTNINVASVNFAMKKLVKKGYVRMVGANPRRLKYYVTPKGLCEKTKLAYNFFEQNYYFYREVRIDMETRIRNAYGDTKKSVAIYGVNELSEISYSVVLAMKLDFAGFFIEDPGITEKEYFGHKVQPLNDLYKISPCLLLLTKEFPEDTIFNNSRGNIETLKLLD